MSTDGYQSLPESQQQPGLGGAPPAQNPYVQPHAEGAPAAVPAAIPVAAQPPLQPGMMYAPVYAVPYGAVAAPMPVGMQPVYMPPGGVLQSMPVRIGVGIRFLLMFVPLIWASTMMAIFVLDVSSSSSGNSSFPVFAWVWYPVFIVLWAVMLMWRLPTRLEVCVDCVRVYTRLTSWSLPYARMASVEVVQSACCWTGAACSFPRTKFTAMDRGVFFRSDACGESIGFTPYDLNQLLQALQATPAARKIVYV